MRKILGYFIDQSLFVNLLSLLVVIAGIFAALKLPREVFPNVEFDIVTVTTVYPGASASEVENLVTNVVEEQLHGLTGADKIYGDSIEGVSTIVIQLDPDVSDKRRVINDIRDSIDRVDDLPEDTEKPVVVELNAKDTPVIELILFGDVSYRDLRASAKAIKPILESVDGVAKVQKKGYRDAEIWVEVDQNKLKRHHVSLVNLISVIKDNNISVPGGLLKGEGEDTIIRTLEQVYSPDDIKKLVIRKSYDGDLVRIQDVAKVRYAFEDAKKEIRANQKDAIRLVVVKKEGQDAINLVDDLKEKITQTGQNHLRPGVKTAWINDYSYYVKRRMNIIISNGLMGFCLVVIILLLMLHRWIAFWTAIAIPLVFCATLAIMFVLGINLHLIAMIALIVVLGILVDDSIVIGENIFRYMERGVAPKTAARNGLFEVVKPVTTTIITTIAAFGPLMFMSGIMGKFIWSIPVVVSTALIASWLESFLILPNHLSSLVPMGLQKKIKAKKEAQHHVKATRHWLMTPIKKIYYRMLAKVIRYRYVVITLFLGLLSLSVVVVITGWLPFILFDSKGMEIFYVRLEMPRTASLDATKQELIKVETFVTQEILPEELDYITATAGEVGEGAGDPTGVVSSHVGQLMIRMVKESERERSVEEVIETLKAKAKETPDLTTGHVRFETVNPGPPVGKAISVRILGKDQRNLKKIGDQMVQQISQIPGVRDVQLSLQEGKNEWRIKVDKKRAADLDVNIQQIATTIQAAFQGVEASTIRTVEEPIEIRVRLTEPLRVPNRQLINSLTVPNNEGRLIPLSKLIRYEEGFNFISIAHYDFEQNAVVSGDIDETVTTSVKVNQHLQEMFKDFEKEHPGYRLDFAGEFEETKESLEDLIQLFVIAFFLVFVILSTTFGSMLQPVIIMACVPFSLTGVVFSFLAHGRSLGFLAMIGVIGLVGVVVNDSIIFVDFINERSKKGKSLYRSILEAGQHRVRPILLTTLTTVLGVMPTAYGIGGNDPFLVPLTLAMAWGLVFGTFITLFLLPCLYATTFDILGLLGLRKSVENQVGR